MSATRYLHLMKALLLLLLALAGILLLAPQQLRITQLPALAQASCAVADSHGAAVFHVYMPSDWQAATLARRLCDDGLRGSAYAQVEVAWMPREELRTNALLGHHFQLLWDREHVLSGLLPDYQALYHLLKPMPDYEIDWFSHRPGLRASASAFAGQRIGLLSDSRSQSGYQLPKLQLVELGVADDRIHYYPNRSELLQAFLQHQLDLIPGLPVQLPHWPADQRLLLTDRAPIGSWYLQQDVDHDLRCRLHQTLTLFDPLVARLSTAAPPPADGECRV